MMTMMINEVNTMTTKLFAFVVKNEKLKQTFESKQVEEEDKVEAEEATDVTADATAVIFASIKLI